MIISVVVAGKLVNVWGFSLSAAILLYSATFLATDTLSEFWGKKTAFKAIIAGLFADIILVYTIRIAIAWEPSGYWQSQEAFQEVLGSTWRIVIASVVGYVAAQSHDVIAYAFLKKRFKGKHMWFRNNASTWVSQLIDSVFFYTIAFWGKAPIVELIAVTMLFKIGIAIIDTPFLYIIKWYYGKGAIAETTAEE